MKNESPVMLERAKAMRWMILLIFLVLFSRLWYLQIIHGHDYAALADGNKSRLERVIAPRGEIMDRNWQKLATNKLIYEVAIVKEKLEPEKMNRAVQIIADVTGVPADIIRERLRTSTYPSFAETPVVSNLGPETIIQLAEKIYDLPGVRLKSVIVRDYPLGETASHVLGYLGMISREELSALSGYYNSDLIGKTGLERAYERNLRGEDGWIVQEVDAHGRPQKVLESRDPIPGSSLVLTIDADLQQVAERIIDEQLTELKEAGKYEKASAGVLIVIDPRNGEVLALASRPGYNPNLLLPGVSDTYFAELQKDSRHPMLNRATQGLYSPGSAFKPVTAAAALDLGKLRIDEQYYATGRSKYGKKDWILNNNPPLPPHGWIDLATALERSANDFFWELSFRVGIEGLAKYARMFGFGTATDIDLYPKDKAGLVPDPEWKRKAFRKRESWDQIWYEAETMDMAIGQGYLLATPLQVAQLYCMLATKGVLYQPHLVRSIVSPTGGVEQEIAPVVSMRLDMPRQYWNAIEKGLVQVVKNPRGTAYRLFRDFPVSIAGKTGSAQVAGSDAHGWFAAYGPVGSPEVVVVAFVENGGGGASAAAPMVRKLLDYYFVERPAAQEAGEETLDSSQ